MISTDHTAALIVANIKDDDNRAPAYAKDLADQFIHDRAGVAVRAGGVVLLPSQVTAQATKDLAVIELIAIPISFAVLVWVFGGALAAALPISSRDDGHRRLHGRIAVHRPVHRGVYIRAEHRDADWDWRWRSTTRCSSSAVSATKSPAAQPVPTALAARIGHPQAHGLLSSAATSSCCR